MLSDIKAVIFDLDGTLYDFRGLPFRLIWSLPSDLFLIKADRKVRRGFKGCDFGSSEAYKAEYGKRMYQETGIKPEDALNWYSNRYMGTMCFLLKRYYSQRPQLAQVFSKLHEKNIKVVVFSDYPRVRQRIRALDFSDDTLATISGIYSAEDFGSQKPAVRPFLEIAKNLEVDPKHCLVVGDRDDTDGNGARATGMHFIQIQTHKTKVIEANHPLWQWEDLAQWVIDGMEPLED